MEEVVMDEMATILVVDDDPDVLSGTVRILVKAGYRTLEASSGRECLAAVSEHHPDLVLVDVVMPDMEGPEVCRRIKQSPEARGTHVVLVSGVRTSPDNQADGLDDGADGYITRPFAKREFLSRVASSLRLKRVEDELNGEIARRKQAEAVLRESEERFRSIVVASPFPTAVVDTDGEHVYLWSRSASDVFGHTASTSSEWYQIAYPDPEYQREVIRRWKSSLEIARESRQTVNSGEYRVTCRDGSERICELYTTFSSGFLVVRFHDITERKRGEVELAEHRDHLEELVEARTSELHQANRLASGINKVIRNALQSATEEDLAEAFLAVAQDLTGSERGFLGEVNASGRFDAIAMTTPIGERRAVVDGAAAMRDVEIQGLWGGVLTDGESMLINDLTSRPKRRGTPEGHPTILNFLGVPLKQKGKVFGMITLVNKEGGYVPQDQEFVETLSAAFVGALMSKRAEVSERLLRAEQQLILDSVRALVWYKDTEHRIIRLNRAAAESIGLSCAEIQGKTDAELFPKESAQYIRDDQEVIQSGQPKHGIVERLRSVTGESIWVLTDKIPILDDSGAVTGLIVFSIDITERTEAQEQAERRASEMRIIVNSMAGRENRMAELKKAIRKLRDQIEEAGMVPLADE